MSIWYSHKIKVFGNRHSLGKLLNLDPENDVHYIDSIDLSFGQKNIPGLRIDKLVTLNPSCIFLIHQTVECFSGTIWIQKFDVANHVMKTVLVESYHEYDREINKNILEEYAKEFPYLMEQHKSNNRPYEWSWFFSNFSRTNGFLDNSENYQEMIIPMGDADMEYQEDGLDLLEETDHD